MVGAVGDDEFAGEALAAACEEAGVELRGSRVERPTGVALILVDADGENQIVVAPGANATRPGFEPASGRGALPARDPDAAVEAAANAAPSA